MSKILKVVLAANLIVLAILAFVYPHLMVGPGKLIPGHSKLETDCFACHAPFFGSTTERCASCHKPDEIGKLTTLGQPIKMPLASTHFHQKLLKQDCLACHSDHAGVKRFRIAGRFDHSLLQADAREECESCHKSPGDSLHQQITGNCSQCHAQDKWVPANFDHDKYFVLDRDHKVKCATCHVRNDYSRYTCYGCHEHSPEKIRREHIKEGIRDFKNCVECHRSADEHDIRMPGREREREREHRRKRGDD
jgi:hypothetical protein